MGIRQDYNGYLFRFIVYGKKKVEENFPHLRKGVFNVFAVDVNGKHLGEATKFFVSLLPVQFAFCVNLSEKIIVLVSVQDAI